MAFDHENHTIDPATGFQVDKTTGHKIGLENRPAEKVPYVDFPKWIECHLGHIVRKRDGEGPEHVSTPAFPECHVDRVTGKVTVLVKDEEEEKLALADPKHDEEKHAEEHPVVLEEPLAAPGAFVMPEKSPT